MESIPIDDVDIQLIRSVTLTDVYAYMSYLSRDRAAHPNSPDTSYGLSASSRARKVATIRSFYKYLTNKAKLLTENPMQDPGFPPPQEVTAPLPGSGRERGIAGVGRRS